MAGFPKSARNLLKRVERKAAQAEIEAAGGSVRGAFESRIGRVAQAGGEPRVGIRSRELEGAREALRSGAGLTGERRVLDIAKREAAGTSLGTHPVSTPKGVVGSPRPRNEYGRPRPYPKPVEGIETIDPYMAADRPGLNPRTAGEAAARRQGAMTREAEGLASRRELSPETFTTRSMGTGPVPALERTSRPNPRAEAERRAGTEQAATGSLKGVPTTSTKSTPSGRGVMETIRKAAKGGLFGIPAAVIGERAAGKLFGKDRS